MSTLIQLTKLDKQGRVLIPKQIRGEAELKPHEKLEIRLVKSEAGWMIVIQKHRG